MHFPLMVLPLFFLTHIPLALSLSLSLSLSLPQPLHPRTDPGTLLILDTGVGHRSTPIPTWPSSLRTLSPSGSNSSTLLSFGEASTPNHPVEPIGAYSLAYSRSTGTAYAATGLGILRFRPSSGLAMTENSTTYEVIVPLDSTQGRITSLTIAEKEQKLYFATAYDGLIRRVSLAGSSVEVVRNVSQGLDFDITASYTPANSFADGLLVDEEEGWMYWSASRGESGGSVRRARIKGDAVEEEEQVLVTGLDMPGQLRLVRDSGTRTNALWFVEKGRWSTSPTALKLVDLSKVSDNAAVSVGSVSAVTMVSSVTMQRELFQEVDFAGESQTLSIMSYVVYRDGVTQRVWFVMQSSGREVFAKLVEVTWQGSGEGRKAVLRVMNENTADLGVPIGLEHIL